MELKTAFSLHSYLCSEHVAALRERVGEMREPPLGLDAVPDTYLEMFFDEVLSAPTTEERRQDWGEAPDVLGFVGRTQEVAELTQWILQDRAIGGGPGHGGHWQDDACSPVGAGSGTVV